MCILLAPYLHRIYTLMDFIDGRLSLPAVEYPHDYGLCLMARFSVYHLLVCLFKAGVVPTYCVMPGFVLVTSYLNRRLLIFFSQHSVTLPSISLF